MASSTRSHGGEVVVGLFVDVSTFLFPGVLCLRSWCFLVLSSFPHRIIGVQMCFLSYKHFSF